MFLVRASSQTSLFLVTLKYSCSGNDSFTRYTPLQLTTSCMGSRPTLQQVKLLPLTPGYLFPTLFLTPGAKHNRTLIRSGYSTANHPSLPSAFFFPPW